MGDAGTAGKASIWASYIPLLSLGHKVKEGYKLFLNSKKTKQNKTLISYQSRFPLDSRLSKTAFTQLDGTENHNMKAFKMVFKETHIET